MRKPTKPGYRAVWAGALACGVVLCGMASPRRTPPPVRQQGHIGPDSLALDSSYFQEACAPNDGPAVTLFFGGRAAPIARGERVRPPYVTISIWRGWSTLAGHTFLLRQDASGGFASYCKKDRSCERLDFARVSFDAVTRDRVRGSADLTLQEPSAGDSMSTYQASIPFNARRLSVRLVCG
jgi:hypothetical protein